MPRLKSAMQRARWGASDIWRAGKRKLGIGKRSFERAMKANPERIKPRYVPVKISRVMGEVNEIQDSLFREMNKLGLAIEPKYKRSIGMFYSEPISTVEFGNAKPEQIRKAFELAEAAEKEISPKLKSAKQILEELVKKTEKTKKKAYSTNRLNRKRRINRFTRLEGIGAAAGDSYNISDPLISYVVRDLKAKLEETDQKA